MLECLWHAVVLLKRVVVLQRLAVVPLKVAAVPQGPTVVPLLVSGSTADSGPDTGACGSRRESNFLLPPPRGSTVADFCTVLNSAEVAMDVIYLVCAFSAQLSPTLR